MALFLELMTTVIVLVTKPFSHFKLVCIFCMKAAFIVLQTWIELLRAAISFHVNMFWKTLIWTVALISLPARVLNALPRERLLEQHLHEMQYELEALLWDRKELEDHLQTASKERRILESILAELEEENDKAVAKIEMLEVELQYLKDENLRLKEIQGKDLWSFKGHDDTGKGQKIDNIGIADDYGIPYGIPSWKSSYKGSGIIFQDLMMHRDAWEGESKSNAELLNFLKTGNISTDLEMNEVLDQRREVALSQSLFSAVLSLLVGMIIWEAEDPCMPLVVALFTVVGMSLKSVVQFFSTVKNKPASDAVALLSFNWFVLGTLTYPTLPRVARMLAPLALSLVDRMVNWLGISSH